MYGDDGQQGRDVLALELNHHEMGGNYLDPRSFGGYDDFNSSISYELPTSFVDNNSQSEKKKKKRDFSNCIKFSEPSSYVSGRVRQRFDSAKHGFA